MKVCNTKHGAKTYSCKQYENCCVSFGRILDEYWFHNDTPSGDMYRLMHFVQNVNAGNFNATRPFMILIIYVTGYYLLAYDNSV